MSEPQPHHQIHLVVPRAQAVKWIQEQIAAGRELSPHGSGMFFLGNESVRESIRYGTQWLDVTRHLLRRLFDRSDIADEWRGATFITIMTSYPDAVTRSRAFRQARDDYVAKLEGMLKRLPFIEEALPDQISPHGAAREVAGREVFVVHGHDIASREMVARFLMQLALEPIILEEEPNAGKTIIEKLEASFDAGDVGYAVVIMTPDDVGAAKGHESDLRPRSRQNVVMELGYAIGLLGRENVCALYKADVELPSDYHGVVYVRLDDSGAWKLKLATELKAAGIEVDLNKAC